MDHGPSPAQNSQHKWNLTTRTNTPQYKDPKTWFLWQNTHIWVRFFTCFGAANWSFLDYGSTREIATSNSTNKELEKLYLSKRKEGIQAVLAENRF